MRRPGRGDARPHQLQPEGLVGLLTDVGLFHQIGRARAEHKPVGHIRL